MVVVVVCVKRGRRGGHRTGAALEAVVRASGYCTSAGVAVGRQHRRTAAGNASVIVRTLTPPPRHAEADSHNNSHRSASRRGAAQRRARTSAWHGGETGWREGLSRERARDSGEDKDEGTAMAGGEGVWERGGWEVFR